MPDNAIESKGWDSWLIDKKAFVTDVVLIENKITVNVLSGLFNEFKSLVNSIDLVFDLISSGMTDNKEINLIEAEYKFEGVLRSEIIIGMSGTAGKVIAVGKIKESVGKEMLQEVQSIVCKVAEEHWKDAEVEYRYFGDLVSNHPLPNRKINNYVVAPLYSNGVLIMTLIFLNIYV